MKKINFTLKTALLAVFSLSAEATVLTHSYQFQGNLDDSVGSLALISDGGVIGSGSYSFGMNQGLVLTGALAAVDSYSIALNFNFSSLNGWQKIIDFSGLGSDMGFYTLHDKLDFYNINNAVGPTPLTVSTNVDVVITRDGSTQEFNAYLNGVKQFSFIDTGSLAVFNGGSGNSIHFFEDDSRTDFREAAPGVVNSIRIWDGALTESQVSNINAVPIPAAAWLFAAGLGLLSYKSHRKI